MIALVVVMAMMLPMASSIPVAAELASGAANVTSGLHTGWMTENYTAWNNTTWTSNRTFEYYIPTSYDNSTAVALLFSFHGLGSNGPEQIDLSKFTGLAEAEGFIAVFPDSTNLDEDDPMFSDLNLTLPGLEGSNIMWNCGNITGIPIAPLQYYAGVDDVAFVSDMVDWFEHYYAINASRIYATGMSNGAMFSYYLAFTLSGTFAGIAPVTGPMDLNLGWNYTTIPAPTTVIAIRSPSDPIIPEAGDCSWIMCNNYSYSTTDTIDYWCEVNNITTPPVTTVWSDDDIDTSTITRYVYGPGTNGAKVVFFIEEGSAGGYAIGHTWPGGPQYQPVAIIGAVSNQIAGTAQIWKCLLPLKYCLTIRSNYIMGSVTTPGHNAFTIDSDPNTNVKISMTTLFFYPGTGSTVVNLVAEPSSQDFKFVKWTGDVGTIANRYAANTTITISPTKDYEIKANFQLKSEGGTTPPSGGCFIATAAYGTPTAKQIDVLRAFRDDVLLKSTAGSRLVDFYYQTSPPIANFISQHSVVRTLVRELLIDPIVWIVRATGNLWQS